MKFTITLHKAHELGANMTGMNMGKNRQVFFELNKKNEDLKIQ